jgi:hypothetical protein
MALSHMLKGVDEHELKFEEMQEKQTRLAAEISVGSQSSVVRWSPRSNSRVL